MIVGIDLGTTNSLAGLWRDGESRLIANALGHLLTPSAVGIGDNGEMLVGLAARERLSTHPQQTVAAFKRYMGTNRVFTLGARDFRPEELSALVLRSLKADVEAWLGEPVHEAIITVPAYFNDMCSARPRAPPASSPGSRWSACSTNRPLRPSPMDCKNARTAASWSSISAAALSTFPFSNFSRASWRCARRPATISSAARISTICWSMPSCSRSASRLACRRCRYACLSMPRCAARRSC